MASTSPADKRWRQSEARRVRNRAVRHRVRSAIRRFEQAVSTADVEHTAAERHLRSAGRLLDSAASKGVYKRNKVARAKSRMGKRLAAAVADR